MGKVLLVDGNNLVARYNHVYYPSKNPDGLSVGGLFGVVQGVRRFLAEHSDHTAVVMVVDRGVPAWRFTVCPEYKQQRAGDRKTPEDEAMYQAYKEQIPHVRNIVRHTGIGFARAKGWEGDDVLAGLALHRFADRECTIYSSDRDFIELADDRVKVYNPLDLAWVPADPFYLVERCMDPKKSDNLDGVPGVGAVGAAAAVQLWQAHNEVAGAERFLRSSRKALEDFLRWCEHVSQWGLTQKQLDAIEDKDRRNLIRGHIAQMSKDEKQACKAAAKVVPHRDKMMANYQVTCLRSIARRAHEATALDVEPADQAEFKAMMRAYHLRQVMEDMSAVWPVFARLDCSWMTPQGAQRG